MRGAAAWWLAIRPRTLGASLVPVGVGLALARRSGPIDPAVAAATLIAALLLQIATNLANDYYDFARGVDTAERLGPVRVTHAGLLAPLAVKRATQGALALAVITGAFLLRTGGWPIAIVGVAAALGAVAYSAGPWPLAWYGLGDLLAFVFFGLIAVGGSFYLQRGTLGLSALLAGFAIGCLVTALLVVNNLRDIPTDRVTGKRTLAVRLGTTGTRIEYTVLVVVAFIALAPLAMLVTPGAFLALLSAPLALAQISGVWRRTGAALNRSLAGTAFLHAVFGCLLIAGLLW